MFTFFSTLKRSFYVQWPAHSFPVMPFLKVSKYVFAIFAFFGAMDNLSTMILIKHHGIGVESNPLIKMAFTHLNFYCFIPHLILVLFAAYQLSRPHWNDPRRFMIKSALFYVYIFIVINNWWQVAELGIRVFLTQPMS